MIEREKEIIYAAFIITYNRSGIIADTIDRILKQSLPPKKILVIDNSDNKETEKIIMDLKNPILDYYYVGHNSGPSGGAYIGLKELANQNFDWLFWVDDDNPPTNCYIIEKIFDILPSVNIENCGQLGLVGHRFNKWTGEIERLEDEELKENVIEVDTIGGGQCKIISTKVARLGIFPEKKLFFGFEDLDIDIKIKKAGFKSYVSGKLFYEARKDANRLNYKRRTVISMDNNLLNRHYYSIRSLLSIFSSNYYISALLYLSIKKFLTVILAFKQGPKAGIKYSKIMFLAYYHFIIGKYGKVNLNP